MQHKTLLSQTLIKSYQVLNTSSDIFIYTNLQQSSQCKLNLMLAVWSPVVTRQFKNQSKPVRPTVSEATLDGLLAQLCIADIAQTILCRFKITSIFIITLSAIIFHYIYF